MIDSDADLALIPVQILGESIYSLSKFLLVNRTRLAVS